MWVVSQELQAPMQVDPMHETAGRRSVMRAVVGQAPALSFAEVRWAKIESLRRQISAGTYFVPADLLAERLLRQYVAGSALSA